MQPLEVTLNFAEFPPEHTCRGGDASPRVRVAGVLPNIKSLAIVATSSPEEGESKAAWVIWNVEPAETVPAGIPKTAEVTAPVRAVQGRNDFGTVGYRGPCPKSGETEAYLFRVYALDIDLHLLPGAGWEDLVRALEGSVNQTGEVVALSTG
ncbi:YbhB/YbcL family Raf kinase inhibitor-like protein [Methanoculleus sp. FWC-SCC1]|uniref:YbhB/YbcL family Raf kinase inhibitor-like protein n=1 Tax=Methanoculleus frigidifontis TaxID=2584085 RepID=A0ABT8M9P9_9EURY|nr:YbhB/YbcL family Raf kinase inhibitor-like protein [Methanoculleus sp. FWC-SCC1]MDN7024635.1 YbhB/YbcL family Raf kinase inhibitor-like protein [Methanoculleus sp. FWC-SCC1]